MGPRYFIPLLLSFSFLFSFESVIQLKDTEGKGVGFDEGYTSLQYLAMRNWHRAEFLFNLRGHVFHSGKVFDHVAGNGGFGFRYAPRKGQGLFGSYLFYDFRKHPHLFAQQVSGGVEYVTPSREIRFNGYLLIDQEEASYQRTFVGFNGNALWIRERFLQALSLVEGEVGFRARSVLYLGVGPYYLFQRHSIMQKLWDRNGLGAKGRLTIDFNRFISVGATGSYDHFFKFKVNGFVALNIPFGATEKKEPKRSRRVVRGVVRERRRLEEKICRQNQRRGQIYHNEIIPLFVKTRTVPFSQSGSSSNVGASLSSSFLFVDNTALPGGNGSFESPFYSLKSAQHASRPGDVIYVFPGDLTSKNMDEGIVLKEKQTLVSSGHSFSVDGVEVPALTPGTLPVITNQNPQEPVVTNGDMSTLSEFFKIFNSFVKKTP